VKSIRAYWFILAALSPPIHAADSKPNTVLIFADDLGWKDMG